MNATAPQRADSFRHEPRLTPAGIVAVEAVLGSGLPGVRSITLTGGIEVEVVAARTGELLGTVVPNVPLCEVCFAELTWCPDCDLLQPSAGDWPAEDDEDEDDWGYPND